MGAMLDAYNGNYASGTSDTGSASGSAGGGLSPIAGGIVSGLTSIATGYINAQRAKNTYKFNAEMARLQGRMMRLKADIEIKNIRKKAASILSEQRAGYARAGIDASEGSPIQVALDSQKEAELDEIYVSINADYGIGTQETVAGQYESAGKSAMNDATTDAFKTILNTGVKTYTRS